MINFDKHIKELLYEEDFFIIPSLGAFIATFTQAEITKEGKLIEPTKSFDFNGLLSSDDGDKFINHIKLKENMSKGEVIDQLRNYLISFKSGLSANGKMVLADVCTISIMDRGNLEGKFNPELDFYTKPSFAENTINVNRFEEIQKYSEIPDEEINEADAEYTGDLEYEENGINTKWVKYLLYLIPLVLIFGALYYVILYKPFEEKQVGTTAIEEKVVSEDLDNTELDSNSVNPSELVNEDVNPKAVIDEIKEGLIAQSTEKFEVSAGLFGSKQNAEKLVSRMEAAGFSAKIKLVNGMRRVYVPVNGIEAAEAMSNKIEQFTGDKSVYFDENGISNR